MQSIEDDRRGDNLILRKDSGYGTFLVRHEQGQVELLLFFLFDAAIDSSGSKTDRRSHASRNCLHCSSYVM